MKDEEVKYHLSIEHKKFKIWCLFYIFQFLGNFWRENGRCHHAQPCRTADQHPNLTEKLAYWWPFWVGNIFFKFLGWTPSLIEHKTSKPLLKIMGRVSLSVSVQAFVNILKLNTQKSVAFSFSNILHGILRIKSLAVLRV